MSGVNKAILIGNLGKDPETNHTSSGISVTKFPLATSETFKDQKTGERQERTEWHNIILWRGLSDIGSKYLKKGDKVYIEGKLRTRSWEKDGVTRYTTEVVADAMTMLSPKSHGGNGTTGTNGTNGIQETDQAPASVPSSMVPANNGSDDLPF